MDNCTKTSCPLTNEGHAEEHEAMLVEVSKEVSIIKDSYKALSSKLTVIYVISIVGLVVGVGRTLLELKGM